MEYQDNPTREFKGIWIPKEIWQNKALSVNEKVLYAEIDSFTTNDKACFMSNQYISELLGITETNASKTLNSLIKKGFVIVEKFDGRRRYVRTSTIHQQMQSRLVANDNSELSQTTRQSSRKRQDTNIVYNIEDKKDSFSFLEKQKNENADDFSFSSSVAAEENPTYENAELEKVWEKWLSYISAEFKLSKISITSQKERFSEFFGNDAKLALKYVNMAIDRGYRCFLNPNDYSGNAKIVEIEKKYERDALGHTISEKWQ